MNRLPGKDYVAVARFLLYGEAPPQNLTGSLLDLINKPQTKLLDRAKINPKAIFIWLVSFLSLWYRAQEDLKKGRLSPDSPEIKALANGMKVVHSVIGHGVLGSVTIGDAEPLFALATVVNAAQNISKAKGFERPEQLMRPVLKALGFKGMKSQKKTQRLRSLLPLWCLGFGQLTYEQQGEILLQAGLSEAEIPEQDTLRQFLHYYGIPA